MRINVLSHFRLQDFSAGKSDLHSPPKKRRSLHVIACDFSVDDTKYGRKGWLASRARPSGILLEL